MGDVLIAIALSEEEAKLLEEIARRKGYKSAGEAVREALELFLSKRSRLSTSWRALYLSQQTGHRLGTSSP